MQRHAFLRIQLVLQKVIDREVLEGRGPDVGEGRADQVVDERPDHGEARLPRRVDQPVQHALYRETTGIKTNE